MENHIALDMEKKNAEVDEEVRVTLWKFILKTWRCQKDAYIVHWSEMAIFHRNAHFQDGERSQRMILLEAILLVI